MVDKFIKLFSEFIGFSKIFKTDVNKVYLVINPAAGTIASKRLIKKTIKTIDNRVSEFKVKKLQSVNIEIKVIKTEFQGHAEGIAKNIIEANESLDQKCLIILLGGDGTSMEFCKGIMNSKSKVIDNLILFRMPLGTGNDGLDATSFDEGLDILENNNQLSNLNAIEMKPRGLDPEYAFNIGTVGLDAYVTHMTNKLKKIMPGSFYKVMIDFSTLFYDKIVGVEKMNVNIWKKGKHVSVINEKFLFVCVGTSGNRTYGHLVKILPGKENVCILKNPSLLRKLQIKGLFLKGEHVHLPEVQMFEADKIEIDYNTKILLNRDGDSIWLKRENFPLIFNIVKTGIKVLKKN